MITIEQHKGVNVLRDDLLTGGTKSILMPSIIGDDLEYVYASPVYGGFQIALSAYCQSVNKKATTIAFIWHKQRTNPGYYTMSECEICVVGKKGKIPTPRGSRNERQFLSELRTKHSKKPDEIRNRINRMFPEQTKIELFARQRYENWDAWGNEVEGSVNLEQYRSYCP